MYAEKTRTDAALCKFLLYAKKRRQTVTSLRLSVYAKRGQNWWPPDLLGETPLYLLCTTHPPLLRGFFPTSTPFLEHTQTHHVREVFFFMPSDLRSNRHFCRIYLYTTLALPNDPTSSSGNNLFNANYLLTQGMRRGFFPCLRGVYSV